MAKEDFVVQTFLNSEFGRPDVRVPRRRASAHSETKPQKDIVSAAHRTFAKLEAARTSRRIPVAALANHAFRCRRRRSRLLAHAAQRRARRVLAHQL